MDFTAEQIAEFLNGKVEGNSQEKVNSIAKIEEAKKGSLSFLSNLQYEKFIYTTEASIVLVNNDFVASKKINSTLIRVQDAYQSLAKLLELYESSINAEKTGIEPNTMIDSSAQISENVYVGGFSYISKNAKIGKNVKIYPQVFIGDNVSIDENSIIYSGVKIYRDCKIGKHCVIHSGVVVGADGFGFAPNEKGELKKIPQIGNVVIEDCVEIGANCTVDRATMGSTVIKRGAKIDNLTMIAHNVEIGENTVIVAQTGISGSTKVGKNCMIGGQVGIIGHISIADEVKIAAQSGIGASIENKGEIVQGSPAYKVRDYQRSYVMFKKLPELKSEIESLKKEIAELKSKK
jgi:UDP-3-O-[3-hydroxymyristoyl] glucosamine N-acyltransferase